jgi:pimeloyl-ACP methyl ester carboxylesterase
MMQRFGMVSSELDVAAFRDVAASFKTNDWSVYSEIMSPLGEHDATDIQPQVDVPTLIVTGDRDVLTPVFTAEKMHRRIARSRLVIIEGGTHYTPVEYPRVIQDEILRFLAGVAGYAPPVAAAAQG